MQAPKAKSSEASTAGPSQGAVWVLALVAIILGAGLVLMLSSEDRSDIEPEFGTLSLDDTGPVADGASAVQELPPAASSESQTAIQAESRLADSGKKIRKTGSLTGQLLIPESLRESLEVWSLELEEAINDVNPRAQEQAKHLKRRFAVIPGASITSFRVAGIPFSEYGWRLVAKSIEPYAISRSAMIMLDEKSPESSVQLKLVPATSVHIVIKDQEKHQLQGVRVTLRPVGFPPARRTHSIHSDIYGLALLQGVALGDYELRVGPVARPLLPARRITISGEKMQFEPIVVPKGGSLSLVIATTAGSGIAKVEVAAIAKDSSKYRKYEAQSDKAGRAKLEHLPPGEYYLHLTKPGYERRFEKLRIKDGQNELKRITLHWDFRH